LAVSERPHDTGQEIETDAQAEAGVDPASDAASDEKQGTVNEAVRPWVPSPPQLFRYREPKALAEAAAKRFLDSAKRAVAKADRFIVVLAGGSTPRRLYRRLTGPPYRDEVPWSKTFFVFGDERCVPPDDEASNYRMVRETLFAPLEIPAVRVLRMKGEQLPVEAARRYEVRLGDLFLNRPKRRFDLVLLGIGADGHTASLFPGTAALEERERWVVANEVPRLGGSRLTLTLPALNTARRVIFLATGEEKARVIAEAFGGVEHEAPHPCERVAPAWGRREVLVDHAAASLMPRDDVAPEGVDGAGDRNGQDVQQS
jgi:6-phosphogluconolactonase